jgi:hypothetical protein
MSSIKLINSYCPFDDIHALMFVLLCVFNFALIMYLLSFFSAPCHLVVLGSLGFWLLLVGCLRCVTHTLHDATGWQSLALNL